MPDYYFLVTAWIMLLHCLAPPHHVMVCYFYQRAKTGDHCTVHKHRPIFWI